MYKFAISQNLNYSSYILLNFNEYYNIIGIVIHAIYLIKYAKIYKITKKCII